MYPSSEKRFLAINYISVVALFLLILAGGVVRSTGSGMGCPDWPKCFDQYIPPTHISQLPANYHEKYVDKRIRKNERFAKTLDLLGYGDLAYRIRNDKSILKPDEFNAAKTWTEYVNRLLGALVGLFLIACVVASITYLRTRSRIFFWSLFNLFLVGFQGWLGSIVVSTNLLAWVVTIHMLVAIAILAISIYTYYEARSLRDKSVLTNIGSVLVTILAYTGLILTVVQITLGTEVREQIDMVSTLMSDLNRSEWVSQVGANFIYHRDLAILVIIVNVVSFVLIRKRYPVAGYQYKYISYVFLLIVLQIITGLILSYVGLPPVAQAIHILLATLVFGAQFYLLLLLKKSRLEILN
ncbi:COX15/CtaA family protein [Daejeonella lutea]|uniref:Cytochrome c oxidase assembly protein subunit 15 n=1 Tax=Daejeonella lutea TaxID=572036 RepID=A0A1T5D1A4_9SPHI|nr:COX15/CtaA family protein [Daejeonella lutea]SKB65280.1 cytochrome c oxidase assembly protein subunit 15 [Daejeonella lutea]